VDSLKTKDVYVLHWVCNHAVTNCSAFDVFSVCVQCCQVPATLYVLVLLVVPLLCQDHPALTDCPVDHLAPHVHAAQVGVLGQHLNKTLLLDGTKYHYRALDRPDDLMDGGS